MSIPATKENLTLLRRVHYLAIMDVEDTQKDHVAAVSGSAVRLAKAHDNAARAVEYEKMTREQLRAMYNHFKLYGYHQG